jgi:hypothetical protein
MHSEEVRFRTSAKRSGGGQSRPTSDESARTASRRRVIVIDETTRLYWVKSSRYLFKVRI